MRWPRAVARRASKLGLIVVATVFASLTLVVAVATPPWEANDESDHVLNAQQFARGKWYRMEDGAGLEAHQAPLYYMALAGWQKLAGIEARNPEPVAANFFAAAEKGAFRHDRPTDGTDQRWVTFLRIPGVLCGLAVVLLTAFAARRLSSDPWTPVVAAAVVAGVPKLVFLSGVVNNDNLANLFGAVLTLLCVGVVLRPPKRWRQRAANAAALGGVLGLLVLTKLSAIPLMLGVAIALIIIGASWRERAKLLAVALCVMLAVCGWYLVQNQVRYGDPLARDATKTYLAPQGGLGLVPVDPALEQAFVTIPKGVYESFWYTSGLNQFTWPRWAYAPYWAALLVALAGLARRRASAGAASAPAPVLGVLAVLAVGALSAVWIVGLDTSSFQARVAFTGLPAIGCLAALGLERLPVPVVLRFVGPALGVVGTVIAIRHDIIDTFFVAVR